MWHSTHLSRLLNTNGISWNKQTPFLEWSALDYPQHDICTASPLWHFVACRFLSIWNRFCKFATHHTNCSCLKIKKIMHFLFFYLYFPLKTSKASATNHHNSQHFDGQSWLSPAKTAKLFPTSPYRLWYSAAGLETDTQLLFFPRPSFAKLHLAAKSCGWVGREANKSEFIAYLFI